MGQPADGFIGSPDIATTRGRKQISTETMASERNSIQRKMAALCHDAFKVDESGMMQVEYREPLEDDLSVQTLSNVTMKARLMAKGLLKDGSREPGPSGDGARSVTIKTRTGQFITMKTYQKDENWITESLKTEEAALGESKPDITHSCINTLSTCDTHSSSASDETSQDSTGSTTVSSGDIHSFITDQVRQESTRSRDMTSGGIHSSITEHQDSSKSSTMGTAAAQPCMTNKAPQMSTKAPMSNVTVDDLLELVKDYPWTDDPEARPGEAQLKISIANLRQQAANKEISKAKLRQEEANKEIMKMLEPSQLDSVFLPPVASNRSASVTGEKRPWVEEVDEQFHDEDPYYDQKPKSQRRQKPKSQRWPIAPTCRLIGLFFIPGTIAFVIWCIVHSMNHSQDSGQCSLCYDGTVPDNLDRNRIGSQTCSEFQKEQLQQEASDPLCTNSQVLSWRYCECPTLPPLENSWSPCQMCPDGSPPESEFCKDYMAFLINMYAVDYSCDEITRAAIKEGCACPQIEAEDAADPELDPRPVIPDNENEKNPEEEDEKEDEHENVYVSSKNETNQHCDFCYDGSIPGNLISTKVGNQTCADYLFEVESLNPSSEECARGQAMAALMCGCPSLPSPPKHTKCTFCYDGSIPEDLLSTEIDGQSCADFFFEVEALDASSDDCAWGQARASLLCGCPSLPAPPVNARCKFCIDGSIPEDLTLTEIDGQSCADFFFEVEALDASSEDCALGQARASLACGCPSLPSPPQHTKCTFCVDGSIPEDLTLTEIDGQTCADYFFEVEALDASSEECARGQARASLLCGCPPPESTNCTFCIDGSIPEDLILNEIDGQSCADFFFEVEALDASSEECARGQARASLLCGCLPLESTNCTFCIDGSIPEDLILNEIDGQSCADFFFEVEALDASSEECAREQARASLLCGCPPLESTNCTFCSDGSIPEDLILNEIDGRSCADFFFEVEALDASSEECARGQARASLLCGCPPPESTNCTFCIDGSIPEDLILREVDGESCADFFFEVEALDASSEDCTWGQARASLMCGCPSLPSPPEQSTCTFCYDGSIPSDLISTKVDGGTCADYRLDVEVLDASSDDCAEGQALAWLMCGCPSLPPPPEHPTCTLCGEGVSLVNQACDDINTFMAHTSDPLECTELTKSVFDVGCTCPSSP